MDLFAAAGIDLSDGGRGGRSGRPGASRTLRVPLFNYKVVAEARKRFTPAPSTRQTEAVRSYVKTIKAPTFAKRKETEVRNLFVQRVLGDILGYTQIDSEPPYTLAFERAIRRGSVDVALGRFGRTDRPDEIMAPFELKEPGTRDLDAIMPGRGRSPVQQAWDYAIDAPGSRWVLVSNCVEIRLYGFGRGRDAYELFDLTKLDDPEEHARLCLILSAERLLGGATDALLRDTDGAYKNITNDLYSEYKELRDRLIGFLTGAVDGPKLTLLSAIELAQKLLDRILFIAFAQRTGLLPDRLLERALAARNEFLPQPLWRNFQALFRNVDRGNDSLYIWAYNGGLFAVDPAADTLELPDNLAAELAKLGQWDYRSDIPVTVLGHVFEQSITDLERLRAESRGEAPPRVSKRKCEGVVYTPEIVTRFLVDKLTIVDPACGSGAFLVAAFDLLAAEYRRVVGRLAALGEPIDFDLFDEMVTRNLYGVDLNAESVEITRLALWLKTARNKHHLQNLEATIKIGNSLIDDSTFTDRPFDWRAAFGDVFAQGGFDVVIGNPPYVRMELIKPIKPYLEKHYVVAADRVDLYAYFFERGVRVLKEGGRLGYISSSTFFRTGSGENLRRFLCDHVAIEAVVDFGDLQIFEGVTTYPAIVALRKGGADQDDAVRFLKVDTLPNDIEAEFASRAQTMPRTRLGHGSWQFEAAPLGKLRDKIVNGKKTLREVYGPPLYGIKTGLNEAFIVDTAIRDRLVAQDSKSADLLKPFLRGENIKRWRVEPEGLFLINTPKGKVNIDDYPAIRDWLLPFKPELENRATKQEWFELQQAQLAYQSVFAHEKIVYQDITAQNPFALDRNGYFLANTCYFIPSADPTLLAFLNSKLCWFFLSSVTKLSNTCTDNAAARLSIESAVAHRILDLAPSEQRRLSRKLEEWCDLDFGGFRAEVERVFHAEIPIRKRAEWEKYLAENAAEVKRMTAEIEAAEREIDAIVYRLFDLTPDEITSLETSLAGQF